MVHYPPSLVPSLLPPIHSPHTLIPFPSPPIFSHHLLQSTHFHRWFNPHHPLFSHLHHQSNPHHPQFSHLHHQFILLHHLLNSLTSFWCCFPTTHNARLSPPTHIWILVLIATSTNLLGLLRDSIICLYGFIFFYFVTKI